MNLFSLGWFRSSSGQVLPWKIDCDALTSKDWHCIATIIAHSIQFSEVEGVPKGGLALADALMEYRSEGAGLLIVDDVLTTGKSMEELRGDRDATGIVLFARGSCPDWVKPLFTLDWEFRGY